MQKPCFLMPYPPPLDRPGGLRRGNRARAGGAAFRGSGASEPPGKGNAHRRVRDFSRGFSRRGAEPRAAGPRGNRARPMQAPSVLRILFSHVRFNPEKHFHQHLNLSYFLLQLVHLSTSHNNFNLHILPTSPKQQRDSAAGLVIRKQVGQSDGARSALLILKQWQYL